MPGKHCCVVDCHNNSEKTKQIDGLKHISYFSFPSDNHIWRSRLIAAVNRSDKSFNPKCAHICSAHFEDRCMLFHGRGYKLIPGSLPTLNMPRKSIEIYHPPPRHSPKPRPQPSVPERVVYYTLEEVVQDLRRKDLNGWIKMKYDGNILILAKYDSTLGVLSKTVTVDNSLDVTVRFEDVVVRAVQPANLEKVHLHDFLHQVDKFSKCTGLTDETLNSSKGYRFVSTTVIDGKPVTKSILRSFCCKGGIHADDPESICNACKSLANYDRTVQKDIHPNTPLSCLSRESLIREVKMSRSNNKKMQHLLQADLKKMAKDLPPEKRYIALLHDEMKIKADLVYDRQSGQVIGFINPENWTFNASEDEEMMNIATHVLVFMVIGINSNIKMSIGHFPTRTSTADVLYPLLWKAIAYLEITCGLKVISSTSDKASPNQRLYRLHRVGNEPVVHKATNPFTEENRCVFFFSDAPHLIKTIRNNVYKSRPGGTKFLWNNGKHILWSHVMQLYTDDRQGHLYRTKLTYDHLYLTSSSTMSVKLAVQVMSNSVAQVMRGYYGPEMSETAKLFSLVNRFFDCLNVRSLRESIYERKPDSAPYTSQNDPRFQFLEREFLEYFEKWLEAVRTRPGFSKVERNKMLISYQTHEGIAMTVKSFIEATRYLLQQGVPYVLSNVFCQDPLEEHFGRHRGLGAHHDNPTIHQFSYQENKLHIQRGLAFQFVPRGNTQAAARVPVRVTHSPLKRMRHQ